MPALNENPFRFIIVGGGIAGLATAIALRGPGRDIVVLERSRMLKENLDSYLQKARPIVDQSFRIFNGEGALQTTIDLTKEKFGADRICYYRQDLHSCLVDAAKAKDLPGDSPVIRTSSTVVACNCKDGIVTLQSKGDLVVGTDGIHSALRKEVIGFAANAKPTGISAYRMLIDTERIENIPSLKEVFDPRDHATTMILGHDRRVIMGPGCGGDLYGIIALVPDEHMHEKSSTESWTSEGSLEKLLETFNDFPSWLKDIFRQAPSIGLWQLRDIDPLPTWVNGRSIIIGRRKSWNASYAGPGS